MKRIILLSIVIIGMIGCEKGDIIPPDDPELFTDITYEVIGSGSVEYAEITYGDLKYSDPNNPNLDKPEPKSKKLYFYKYNSLVNQVIPFSIC